jgi:hypothetical protein
MNLFAEQHCILRNACNSLHIPAGGCRPVCAFIEADGYGTARKFGHTRQLREG